MITYIIAIWLISFGIIVAVNIRMMVKYQLSITDMHLSATILALIFGPFFLLGGAFILARGVYRVVFQG
jgi:hypothetical protein